MFSQPSYEKHLKKIPASLVTRKNLLLSLGTATTLFRYLITSVEVKCFEKTATFGLFGIFQASLTVLDATKWPRVIVNLKIFCIFKLQIQQLTFADTNNISKLHFGCR